MDISDLTTQRVEAERAKCLYAYGHITREKAEEMARPYIDSANEIGKAIAKRFGQKHKQITMVGFFR